MMAEYNQVTEQIIKKRKLNSSIQANEYSISSFKLLPLENPLFTKEFCDLEKYQQNDTFPRVKIQEDQSNIESDWTQFNTSNSTLDNHPNKISLMSDSTNTLNNLPSTELTQKEPIACAQCDYKTFCRSSLTRHMITVHSNSTFQCEKCDFKTCSKINLNRHKNNVHSTKIYKCTKCDYIGRGRRNFQQHESIKHPKAFTRCPYDGCSYQAPNKTLMNAHIKIKHIDIKNIYACDQCDYKSNNKYNFNKHKINLHSQQKFECKIENCNFVSQSREYLRKHIKQVHQQSIRTPNLKIQYQELQQKNEEILFNLRQNLNDLQQFDSKTNQLALIQTKLESCNTSTELLFQEPRKDKEFLLQKYEELVQQELETQKIKVEFNPVNVISFF